MRFSFVSDFDNTITQKDFYWLVVDKYLGEKGCQLTDQWKKQKMKDIDYLNCVFNDINQSEATIRKDIDSIPIDNYAIDFLRFFKENIGNVVIVSAGCRYYIDQILDKYGIQNLMEVYANPGYYHNQNIYMIPDPETEYYSDRYGIDKGKIIEIVKRDSDFVFFAGDSRPDYSAAEKADFVFARKDHELAKLLYKKEIEFTSFDNFDLVRYITLEKINEIRNKY